MHSDETNKEIAVAAGKYADLAKQMGTFMGKFISGPLEQLMGIWEDKLKYRRWENQLALMQKAQYKMNTYGISALRPIPLKIAIPLFEFASLEDNTELQDLWANLLINSSNANSGMSLELAYVEILKSLSTLDARIMQTVYSLPFEESLHKGILTRSLPDRAELPDRLDKDKKALIVPPDDVVLSLANLDRLGCINVARSMGGGQLFYQLNPTLLGKRLVDSCTLKDPNGSKD